MPIITAITKAERTFKCHMSLPMNNCLMKSVKTKFILYSFIRVDTNLVWMNVKPKLVFVLNQMALLEVKQDYKSQNALRCEAMWSPYRKAEPLHT